MKNVFGYITVAAANSTDEARENADFVCTGKHDELLLQKAIDECQKQNKQLYLLNGVYQIDGFYDFGDGGPKTAVCVPNSWREFIIMGQGHEYGFRKSYDNGVTIYVNDSAFDSVQDEQVDVIRSSWTSRGIQNGASLRLENLAIILDNNRHKVRCVDLRRTDRAECKNVTFVGYGGLIHEINIGAASPDVAEKGCIALTMTDGSNYNYSNYTNVFAYGFDEAIQVGGEHVVCINCGAALSTYGFTFGNYEVNCGSNHPITMINCLDERNINLPLFGHYCGDSDGKGGRVIGGQEITMISYNLEILANPAMIPGGKFGSYMRELVPGSWKGNIDFTVQPAHCHTNTVDAQVWENDGSGVGIKTRNNCHKTVCSTEERLSYYPTHGQQVFDTDKNKMVVCIDVAKKLWVDFNGNPVD
ncbi:MAG: hypothetical protein IJN07_04045 [Clostridia bacterium]|nr:hypothetical protein [Clostridia bacterium]